MNTATLSTTLLTGTVAFFASLPPVAAQRAWDHDPYAITDSGTSLEQSPASAGYGQKEALTPLTQVQNFIGIEDEGAPGKTFLDTIQVMIYRDDLAATPPASKDLAIGFFYDKRTGSVGKNSQLAGYPNTYNFLVKTDISTPQTGICYTLKFKPGFLADLASQPGITHPRKLFIVATLITDPKQPHCVAVFTVVKPKDLPSAVLIPAEGGRRGLR